MRTERAKSPPQRAARAWIVEKTDSWHCDKLRRDQYLREANSPGKDQRLTVNAECQWSEDSWWLCGWHMWSVVCAVVNVWKLCEVCEVCEVGKHSAKIPPLPNHALGRNH